MIPSLTAISMVQIQYTALQCEELRQYFVVITDQYPVLSSAQVPGCHSVTTLLMAHEDTNSCHRHRKYFKQYSVAGRNVRLL